MANTIKHKEFTPNVPEGTQHATLPRQGNWRWQAIAMTLRPCGATAYEAQSRHAERGGAVYSVSYMASAQYARSEYSPLGYGITSRVETVRQHLDAARAHGGDQLAAYVWQSLPESLRDDAAELLVMYGYALGGKAVGHGTIADDLPASADDALARRDALTGAAKAASKGKRTSRKKTAQRRK